MRPDTVHIMIGIAFLAALTGLLASIAIGRLIKRRAEALLKDNLRFLSVLIDTIPNPVYCKDRLGRYIDCNVAFATQLFELPKHKVLGKTLKDLAPMIQISAEMVELFQRRDEELFKNPGLQSFEAQVKYADGTQRTVLFNKASYHDRSGAVAGIVGVMVDLSEQKKVEQALRDSEERFRAIFENMTSGIGVLGLDGRYIQVNERYAKMMGYTAQELLSRSPLDLTHPDDRAATKACLDVLLGPQSKDYILEKRFVRKDGTSFWAEVSATPICNPDGSPRAFVGIITDISERKQAEEALKLAQFSIEHSAEAAFWLTADGHFFYVNEAACRTLGYRRAELLSMTVHDIDPNFPKEIWPTHWQDLKTHGSLTFESAHRRKDGSLIPVEITANYLEFSGQEYNFAYAHNITKRKKAEEEKLRLENQLRQSQKMEAVGQLAGGIAHDFNNLLSIILGNIALLKHELPPRFSATAPVSGELEQIEHAAQRAAALTRQLLTFSRRQVAKPINLNLNQVVTDTEKMLRRIITENISLKLELAADLATVCADPGQIEQIIINLALNARDAMPAGGILTIETSNITLDHTYVSRHAEIQPGHYVLLSVSDTGYGMSAEVQEHLFEPFFTTKPVGEGTGLGLATVYGIVKQSSGHVVVYSESGKGTTFKIYLPLSTDAALPLHPAATDEQSLRGVETVLVCEDDEGVRNLAVQILRQAGYTVLSAANGRAALELAEQYAGRIDLLVADVIMPDINGKQLAEKLRCDRSDIKILFISGYAANIIAHHGVADTDVHFLGKPFSRESLLEHVRSTLGSGDEKPAPPTN